MVCILLRIKGNFVRLAYFFKEYFNLFFVVCLRLQLDLIRFFPSEAG